jgi:hypothetical protein
MKIKRRDGTVIEVPAGYTVRDGETLVVGGAMFMDSGMITDSRGHVAGSRPGFLFADDDIGYAVSETNRRMYIDEIEQRWRSGRWQSPSKPAPSAPPTFDGGDAAVAAAHAQYRADIQNRWRR